MTELTYLYEMGRKNLYSDGLVESDSKIIKKKGNNLRGRRKNVDGVDASHCLICNKWTAMRDLKFFMYVKKGMCSKCYQKYDEGSEDDLVCL